MHIELLLLGLLFGALALVIKLTGPLQRSWVERDLHMGDLRVLSDFALFRDDYPPSIVVDRLCERGFLAKTGRGRPRMTLKGWVAVLLRNTSARRRLAAQSAGDRRNSVLIALCSIIAVGGAVLLWVERNSAAPMDFIERHLDFSPDHGDGSMEVVLVTVLVMITAIAVFRLTSKVIAP